MSDKLAIDIALLPPDKVMEVAIAINQQYGPEFNLNKTDCLPHITLSQAIINKKDLPEAVSRLRLIASSFKPLKLKARLVTNFIEPYENERLNSLHKTVMGEFEDLVSYDSREEYFYDDYVRETSLGYVRDYRTKYALSNYYPHLTLGITKPVKKIPNIDFAAKRLAICHLGNYNTCRKILAEVDLK